MRCGVIKVCGINNNAKRRGGGTSDFSKQKLRRSPTWLLCCRKIVGLAVFIFNFQVAFGVRHWVLCPWLRIHKISNAHPRFDTSTLQPVPETHLGFTKSQGLYVPASIKTLSTYPENHHFCCIKNATIAEILPN